MTVIFWTLFAFILLAAIAAGLRARRTALNAAGVATAWQHRNAIRSEFEAKHGNARRRMG